MIGHALRTLLGYLRTPAGRSAETMGDAIEEEIAFHVVERTQEYMAEGMSEDEAKRRALLRFGDASRVAAECHAASIGGLVLWHRLHLAMTALLTIAVGLLWFQASGLRDGTRFSLSQLPPGIASMLDNDWTGDITGRILDEQQQPIADARVLIDAKTWPDGSYFQRAYEVACDADGRFRIDNVHPVNTHYEVQITAVAKNCVFKSRYFTRSEGVLEPVEFALSASSTFTLQLESETGEKLRGVAVMPHCRVEVGGEEHLFYADAASRLTTRTDSAGRVPMPYFRPGERGIVLVHTSGDAWEPHDFSVPSAGEVVTIHVSLPDQAQAEET